MSLINEIKGMQQTITDFMERMDSIKNQFRSDMKSLKTTGMIDSKKTEVKSKNSIESERDEIETPKVNQKQVRPQCSDDDFLGRPVVQKHKKPLCLSIKRSAKNQSKCAVDRHLMDVVRNEERKVPENQGKSEDETKISISWTIKIKESSARQTNQVSITGSEQIDWANAGSGKSLSGVKQSKFEELEEELQQSVSNKDGSSTGLPEVEEAVKTLKNDDANWCRNEYERECFKECRVVIRKLSTSCKIFQPKVVLQQLTKDEIDRICGSFQEAEQGKSIAVDSTARYTSLILEPARKSPRVFSTVKMRCSVTRLILTPPQVNRPISNARKSMPEQSCNEMVKSMFKRSKCVQEWRARARTKDAGQCALNARKLLDSQESHPRGIQWNTSASKPCRTMNRSKCPQRKEMDFEAKEDKRKTVLNSPTTDLNAATFGKSVDINPKNASILMKPKEIEEPSSRDRDMHEKDLKKDQGNAHNNKVDTNRCNSVKIKKHDFKKESDPRKISTEKEPKLKIQGKTPSNAPRNPDGPGVSKYQPDLANTIREFENSDVAKEVRFTKSAMDADDEKAMVVNDLKSVLLRGKTPCPTIRSNQSKSPQKMVLITPTRLKYIVKTRNVLNTAPLHSDRVTRSRIKIEHAPTDSGTHPKNGNVFPGSQLTFLIESFRR